MFTKFARATPIRLADQLDHLERGLVAVVGELGDERPGELAAIFDRPREAGSRPLARRTGRASRASAVPDASDSTHPWLGQFP